MPGFVTINEIAPNQAQIGQQVALIAYSGGFGATPPAGATLQFQNQNATESYNITTFVSWSDNMVIFTVPTVTNVNQDWTALFIGGGLSNSPQTILIFTSSYIITGVSPDPANPATDLMTITGTFPPTQGTGRGFYLQTAKGESITDLGPWSSTQIQFYFPEGTPSGFLPGLLQEIQLWERGNGGNIPAQLYSNALILLIGDPFVYASIPSPGIVAPSQTLQLVGAGLGYTQGSTTVTYSPVGGSTVPISPSSWVTAQTGTYTGSAVVSIQVPAGADLGNATITFTNGSYTSQLVPMITIQNPLVLPGGTTATVGEPVELTGTGFGSTFGALTYFPVGGSPAPATPTDWASTLIRTNIPDDANTSTGFFWVFPTGQVISSSVFTGFTVGTEASSPAATLFSVGQPVVSTVTDGTYPIAPGATFPRGVVVSEINSTAYNVNWWTGSGYSEEYSNLSDLTSVGPLCSQTQALLGIPGV